MTDRELLKLAAKAAGYVVEYDKVDGRWHRQEREGQPSDCWPRWNPLHDDADAFRLMVALDINVEFTYCQDDAPIVIVSRFDVKWTGPNFPDSKAATRRAITRAAAEIQMQREPNNG